MYDTGGSPKERPQMPNLLRFGTIFFVQSDFPHLHALLILSTLVFPTSSLIPPFSSPMSKEVNNKLTYRGQNDSEHILFLSVDWPEA